MSARDDYPDPSTRTDAEAMWDEIDRLRAERDALICACEYWAQLAASAPDEVNEQGPT